MKLRKGDMVIVIAGKDKGKTGKVVRAFPAEDALIVEGINVKKKHQRARKANQKGQIIDKAFPIHVSNVQLVDPKTGTRTRVKIARVDGKRVRVAQKSGTTI